MLNLRRLFDRKSRPVKGTDGALIWAVGDVHGRLDLLESLLATIADDFEATSAGRKVLVFLGDYIDRGPNSAGVLERLSQLRQSAAFETVLLRGNHEDRFLAFLAQPETGRAWCEFGGRETLWSYGITPPNPTDDPQAWVDASEQLRSKLPRHIAQMLMGMETAFSLGDFYFVHAGARWGVALADQAPSDQMWIRDEFLQDTRVFDKIIVHGHTPHQDVHSDHRRIGIDTGAYATGVLTGLRLFENERGLVQAKLSRGQMTTSLRTLA